MPCYACMQEATLLTICSDLAVEGCPVVQSLVYKYLLEQILHDRLSLLVMVYKDSGKPAVAIIGSM